MMRVRAGVYAMRGCMHRRVGAMRKCDVCYMMCYAMYAVQVRCAMQDGQAGRSAGTGNTLCKYVLCDYVYEIVLKARDFGQK